MRKSYLLFLAACFLVTTGCAVTPEKFQSSLALHVQNQNSLHNPEESEILSEIASMKSGEKGAVDGTEFVIGEAYSSASGLSCKPVLINYGSAGRSTVGRVACDNGQAWFFVASVFESEARIDETDFINADVGVLK